MTLRTRDILAQLARLTPHERNDLAAAQVAELDTNGLARVPAAWFAALDRLAKSDPHAAGRLAAAMYAHLAAHRPESPAPLDDGFVPTEPVPTRPPSGTR